MCTEAAPSPPSPPCPPDVRLCGHLRKQKSQRLRFFVLRANPPRLECYESEKKFRAAAAARPAQPRRCVSLEGACTISKRSDARQRHLIVVYTRDSSLGVAAASEAEQQAWYSALLQVRAAANAAGVASPAAAHEDPGPWLPAPFQDVWPVTLRPKGLGRTRGLGGGSYHLCLGSGALSLLRKPGSRRSRDGLAAPPVLRLSLLSVRRCGHAGAFFFLELGRSAPTGPGELWLQAPDAVVARSIHDTVLDAMKRLGGGAEPLPWDLPAGPRAPLAPTPYDAPAPAPAARPRGLGEKAQATLRTLARLMPAASRSGALGRAEAGAAGVRVRAPDDYVHMGGDDGSDYVWMAGPSDAGEAPRHAAGAEYVLMNPFPPTAPATQPRGPRRADGWSRLVREPGRAGPQPKATPPPDSCLNYIDLDLVPALEVGGGAPEAHTHNYVRIKF
ncbi:insulin receptor substrate 1-like [Perognathus longimembris pacificus]|uniref:insulin receptor substrate 1-like n=1 Tax=Perognathus longimembris pacificus TaxID=214514 RepID=UPI002018C478|nr:insulin receptor substrate 1-like [Perognathus longimembris pacificus]